jgi:hypothetical protein
MEKGVTKFDEASYEEWGERNDPFEWTNFLALQMEQIPLPIPSIGTDCLYACCCTSDVSSQGSVATTVPRKQYLTRMLCAIRDTEARNKPKLSWKSGRSHAEVRRELVEDLLNRGFRPRNVRALGTCDKEPVVEFLHAHTNCNKADMLAAVTAAVPLQDNNRTE